MRKLFLLAILALAPSPALSAKWAHIESTEHVQVFLNEDSIAFRGGYRQAWFKYEYKTIQKSERDPSQRINQRLFLMYFDCITKRTSHRRTQMRLDDKIIEDYIDKESYFTDIEPDTSLETAASFVCSFKLNK